MAASSDALFERHAVNVYRYFRRLTGRPDLAEDLTQDVFLRIVRAANDYEPRGPEARWVFRIAQNVLADRRKKANIPELPIAEAAQRSEEPAYVLAISFQEALRMLPTLDREVYLLREQGGLAYEEIAESCAMTPEAVRSRLFRARRHIKHVLGSRLTAGRAETE
jgi:RNA polymerase sigma-70 factor (ECF subfamily)